MHRQTEIPVNNAAALVCCNSMLLLCPPPPPRAMQIIAEHGRVDILVNNAGCASMGPAIEQDLEDFKAVFDVNVFGILAVTQVSRACAKRLGFGV